MHYHDPPGARKSSISEIELLAGDKPGHDTKCIIDDNLAGAAAIDLAS